MKTIYLREKKSGNFEFSYKEEATHKFRTQKAFKEFYNNSRRYYSGSGRFQKYFGYIVKATYSQAQTYFNTPEEVLEYIKKNNIF